MKNKISLTIKFICVLIFTNSCTQAKQEKNSFNSHSTIITKIKSYVKEQKTLGFKGVVIVSKNDSIIYKTNQGDADSFNSPFYIASLSKQFTASAIMKLYEDKLLKLDDKLGAFFEKVPADKKEITIHHLLTHTSGFPNNYVADGIIDRTKALQTILAEPLENEIGSKFMYSAEGYNLLAIIIETISGKSFEEYLQNNILNRFKMSNTGFWGRENKEMIFSPFNDKNMVNKLSKNIFNQGKPVSNYGYKGATGMYSTINDLYNWTKSIRNNQFLSTKNTALLFEPYANVRGDSSNGTYYGYGWFVKLVNNQKIETRHGGSEDGLHNGIIRWNNKGYSIIVLSNQWADNIEGRLKGVEWSTVLSIGIRDLISKE